MISWSVISRSHSTRPPRNISGTLAYCKPILVCAAIGIGSTADPGHAEPVTIDSLYLQMLTERAQEGCMLRAIGYAMATQQPNSDKLELLTLGFLLSDMRLLPLLVSVKDHRADESAFLNPAIGAVMFRIANLVGEVLSDRPPKVSATFDMIECMQIVNEIASNTSNPEAP